jgi:hypothetical protein
LLGGNVPVAGASQLNQNHVSLANQDATHSTITLPPLHIAGGAQFSVEANRGHVVVLHPVKKKAKKKIRLHRICGVREERTEAIVNIHECTVLN